MRFDAGLLVTKSISTGGRIRMMSTDAVEGEGKVVAAKRLKRGEMRRNRR
jgi:hypothetical protein